MRLMLILFAGFFATTNMVAAELPATPNALLILVADTPPSNR